MTFLGRLYEISRAENELGIKFRRLWAKGIRAGSTVREPPPPRQRGSSATEHLSAQTKKGGCGCAGNTAAHTLSQDAMRNALGKEKKN
jgi:hypothetical protein